MEPVLRKKENYFIYFFYNYFFLTLFIIQEI